MLNNIRPEVVLAAFGVAGETVPPIEMDVVFNFFEVANAPSYYAGGKGGGGGGGGGTSGCCASGTHDDVTYHHGNGGRGGGGGYQGNNH